MNTETAFRTIAVIFLIDCLAYLTQACTGQVEIVASQCFAASVEAGGDITQCSADVRRVNTNPIVVSCDGQQPTADQVGLDVVCSKGLGNTWCCIPEPCAEFNRCAAAEGSTIDCYAGTCACALPTQGGRNEAVVCQMDQVSK